MKMARKHHPIQTFDKLPVPDTYFFRKKAGLKTYLIHALTVFGLFAFWFVIGIIMFFNISSAVCYAAMIITGTYGMYRFFQILTKKQVVFPLIKLFAPKTTHRKG